MIKTSPEVLGNMPVIMDIVVVSNGVRRRRIERERARQYAC